MGADCLGQTGKSILEAAVVLLPVAAADQAGPRQSLVVVQIRDSLVVDNSLLLVDILIESGQRDVLLISAVPWCRTTPLASTAPHTACHRRRSDVAYADMAAVRRVRRSSVGSVPCSAKDERVSCKVYLLSVSRLAPQTGCKWPGKGKQWIRKCL